jgi:hypothetical protein
MTLTNTPAYFGAEITTLVKSFMIHFPEIVAVVGKKVFEC